MIIALFTQSPEMRGVLRAFASHPPGWPARKHLHRKSVVYSNTQAVQRNVEIGVEIGMLESGV